MQRKRNHNNLKGIMELEEERQRQADRQHSKERRKEAQLTLLNMLKDYNYDGLINNSHALAWHVELQWLLHARRTSTEILDRADSIISILEAIQVSENSFKDVR